MFRPMMLALVPVAAMACYSTPVYTYPDPLPPPPPPPRETTVTQAQPGNTTIVIQGSAQMGQPAGQACVASFYDEHPVPYERGGGWCQVRGPHCHDYMPPYTEQYVYRDNSYYFGADVEFYYQDYHPVPTEFGGGWCNLHGTHSHRYRPWHDFDFEPTRRVYVYRPTPTNTYPTGQRPTPTYPGSGTSYGNDVRTYPAGQPTNRPTPTPTYPTTTATYPQPTYPQAQPTYPQAQPTYPQAQPTYPQAQPTYPQAQPTYPSQPGNRPSPTPSYPTPQPTYAQPVPAQPTPTPAQPRPIPYGNDVQAKPANPTYPAAQPVPAANPAPTPAHPVPASQNGNVEIIRFDHPTAQKVEPAVVYEAQPTGTPNVANPAPQPRPTPSSPAGGPVFAQPVNTNTAPMGTVVAPRNDNAFQPIRPYQPPTPQPVQPGSQGAYRAAPVQPVEVGRSLGSDRAREVKIETVNANSAAPANAPGQQKKKNTPAPVPTRGR